MFILHERLQADSFEVLRMSLSRVLLMNDRAVPWLILVPERENIRELHELVYEDRSILMEEIVLASRVLQELYSPAKINIGSLGNIVSQLHIHIIGRFKGDRAWPGPIWGTKPVTRFAADERQGLCETIKKAFVQRATHINLKI